MISNSILVNCPTCNREWSFSSNLIGRGEGIVSCPDCRSKFKMTINLDIKIKKFEVV